MLSEGHRSVAGMLAWCEKNPGFSHQDAIKPDKTRYVVHVFNLSTKEVEAGGSEVGGQPGM